ncbi:MAG TPA: SDR family oxidoreductase [Candidatus Deferrimicrobium sp.]|nr:SDR family oxidoreductase [Candidatus Deferrimicrobium sp.]
MKLKNKVAIITGAGAGMGKATAILFAKEGAKICANSQSSSAQETVNIIKNNNGEAIFVQGDISKPETAEQIVKDTIDAFGKIDILFNNAGIVIPGRVDNMSLEDWIRTFEVNVHGVFLVTKACLPELKKTKGTVIHNASVLAVKGVKERAAYSASKGALIALTRAMAADYIEEGIRVNCLCPGTTDTESLARRIAQFDDPIKAKADFIARQPMKRLGTPEEMAEAALYLATAEFSTGIYLSVDGGATI